MGSLLGFHPPHFSEDSAWLPGWLQPSTIREDSHQALAHPSRQGLEEMLCLKHDISARGDGNMSDDGRCMSFRLFLSGEDGSPMEYPSCSGDREVQYHLCLSLTEVSDNSLNPLSSKSQAERFEFNQALPVQQPDAKVIPEEDVREVDYNAVEAYMVPSQQRDHLGILGNEYLSLKEQKGMTPKVVVGSHEDDVDDAIELAVAASEALTIHEIVKDEPSMGLLTASAVLEAAMHVKQARLEEFKETLSNFSGESNDPDFLSDLDESTMADAYEDVGLTASGHADRSGYESISCVKDSYTSESYMSYAKQNCNEPGGLEVVSGSISPKKQHKQVNSVNILLKRGLLLESFGGDTCQEQVDHAAVGMDNADLAFDIGPMLSCSAGQADFCTTKVGLQREGFTNEDQISSQTSSRSLQSGRSGYNEREDKMKNLVPDRFQSRWFGGWTWKNEASAPAVTDHKHERCIHEPFANETSSLSESADIAPDKNSCIQKQDSQCKIVSQSSVAPRGTCEKARNNGNLCLEDVGVSPSVSQLDPLCSVVPCSFALDSGCGQIFVSQEQKQQVNIEKHLGPTTDPNLDNLKTVSPQGAADIVHDEGRSISPTIRRQVASLKTYSMLYPRCGPYLDKGLAPGESSPFEHAPNVVAQHPVLDKRDVSHGHNQTAKGDTKFPSHMEEEIAVNTSRRLSSDIGRDENLDRMVVPDSNDELLPIKVSRNVESKCKSYLVPRRKRVHFSEAEIRYPELRSRRHDVDKNMVFQDVKFLLTGFSVKKHKQMKSLIEKSGGIVLDDVPSRGRGKKLVPVIVCPRRVLTTKFLYGCAVNARILSVKWVWDSVDEGRMLPAKKYMILKEHASRGVRLMFENVGIMLHGKQDFCSKIGKVIKHGGGSVFKSFRWLVKAVDSKEVVSIVVEDESRMSRQLKQCALERKIRVMPFDWIVNSLYAGRLLPPPEAEAEAEASSF